MPYQLILSTDTLDQGRVKINDFFSNNSSGLFTGSTGTDSIIQSSNYNVTSGNRSFVVGRQNSGITSNYSSITGGKENKIQGAFGFAGAGYRLVTKNASNYAFLGTGFVNYISNASSSDFNTVLNGTLNFVETGNFSQILNGTYNSTKFKYSQVLNGRYNSCHGDFNSILNGKYNSVSSSLAGRSYNTIINGKDNYIGGTGSFGDHSVILGGYKNKIKNTVYSVILAGKNNLTSAPHTILAGNGITASTSYNLILGSSNTNRVRLNFSTSPGGFLNTGSWNGTGADYGEYFEWKDGNLNNINKTGYFVELNEGKIQISTSDNVLGIVSNTTSFIGDSVQDYWTEMYLKDEWGVVIKENYEVYEFDNKNESDKAKNLKIKVYFNSTGVSYTETPSARNSLGVFTDLYSKSDGVYIETIYEPMMNPQYDETIPYIARDKRKEWSVIGLLGKLRVRTSEQITGNYVDVDTNTGMAKNGTKYHVMQKIKDFDGNYGVVTIFFK